MDFIIGAGGKPQQQGGPAAGAAKDWIKDGTAATFVADVIETSMQALVLVDFWATWCGPCKQLGPALEKVVREFKGAVRLVKVDVDRNQELAAQLRIQSVPTVYAFKGGRPVDAFTGALPDSQLKAFIQRHVSPGADDGFSIEEILAQAKEILDQGDIETAAQIYQEMLAEDPSSAPATAGLLRCLMAAGQLDQAQAMLGQLPPELAKNAEIVSVRTALELAAQAGATGPAADLRRRLSTDPNDHQARFNLAMAYYAGGEMEPAVDELLELFRRDRAWNEDAARKQLVKFFEAFGPTHPLTVSGRRKLSALLFS